MELNGRVALVTGTRRIGGVVAKTLASRGADVAIVYNRSAMEAEAAAVDVRAQGRRALVLQADVANDVSVTSLVGAVDRELGRLDVLVNMASLYRNVAVRSDDAVGLGQADVARRSTRHVSVLARGRAGDAPHGRRAHHQFLGLARRERAAALQGLSRLLRREGRRESADRGARARARGRPDSRQRDRARPDPRAAGHDRRGIRGRRARDAARHAGADPRKLRRPSSPSSNQTSSRGKRSGWTGEGTYTDNFELRTSDFELQTHIAIGRYLATVAPSNARIDSSAPVSSRRSRAKQNRT